MIDVLVAGAGPAGLSAAVCAAQAGLETVILDPRAAPIDKACGEGLMPGARRNLQALGVQVQGHPISGIRYLRGSYLAQAQFAAGAGAGVRRTELHDALVARATALGVRWCAAEAGTIAQDEDRVQAAGLQARYLIAADGLHSPIRHQLGLDVAPKASTPRRWGQRRHFELEPWTDFVEVHWCQDTEIYVTPLGPRLVGVAVLSSRQRPFAELVTQCPAVFDRLAGRAVSDVRGAGPLRQASSRRVAGRVALLGDAAGYVDALTGEGIAVGVACAAALVQCLQADRPQDYERRWRTASRRYRVITESLLRLRSPNAWNL